MPAKTKQKSPARELLSYVKQHVQGPVPRWDPVTQRRFLSEHQHFAVHQFKKELKIAAEAMAATANVSHVVPFEDAKERIVTVLQDLEDRARVLRGILQEQPTKDLEAIFDEVSGALDQKNILRHSPIWVAGKFSEWGWNRALDFLLDRAIEKYHRSEEDRINIKARILENHPV